MIGELTITVAGAGEAIAIQRADRFIQVSDALVEQLTQRGWVKDSRLTIEARNGTVSYHLSGPDAPGGYWLAELLTPWPPSADGCPTPMAAGRTDRCGLYSHPARCTADACSMPVRRG